MTGVLVPVGVYCLKNAYQRDRSALAVAAIPLVFGIQQSMEGLVWVGVGRGDYGLTQLAAIGYLFFALQFWLFWIPFSSVFLARTSRGKLLLGIGAVVGLAGGAELFWPVVLRPEALSVAAVRHSIRYDYADPPASFVAPQIVWHMFYVSLISLPLFLVREKRLVGYSTLLVVSAVISHFYFWYAFASIWCFFAAIISLYLGHLFRRWPTRGASASI